MVPLRFLLGLAFSSFTGVVAYRKNSLTASGAVGAILVGTLIVGFGGWAWGMLLIAFFVSSSMLSHYRRADKAAVSDKFAKGHRRDLGQTLANGGLGALLAGAHGRALGARVPRLGENHAGKAQLLLQAPVLGELRSR